MSDVSQPIPHWGAWLLRALIYAGFAGLLYWWHPVLGTGAALFITVDLVHHAADTVRRRSGYVPIPRHPSNPDTPQPKLKMRVRPLLILFGIVWAIAAIMGRSVLGASWAEAMVQSLALAAFVAAAGALFFPFAARILLWLLSVTVGFLLSLGDLLAGFIVSSDRGRAWHRRVDQTDHRLADLILAQSAAIPLRADLAERAAEAAKDRP